jgi:hypothetical protein
LLACAEFDKWYAESFLNQAEEEQSSLVAGHGLRAGVFLPINPNTMVSSRKKPSF